MAVGRFAYVNLALTATVTGPPAGWSTRHPLANLLTEGDYVGAPARCLAADDLALSRFELVLDQPASPTLVAFLFHTMSIGARIRVTGALLDDPGYAAPTLATGWRWVFPSLYDQTELEYDFDNVFTGTVTAAEIALLKRHMTVPLAPSLVQRLKVEVDDQEHPDGFFDIGGVYLASGISPGMNFDRGRELSVISRDLVDEAPSGRRLADRRPPRRVLSISYSYLEDAEARRFVDAALTVRNVGTVLFIPDLDDVPGAMREAFPATFGRLPSAAFSWAGLAKSPMTFEEILA